MKKLIPGIIKTVFFLLLPLIVDLVYQWIQAPPNYFQYVVWRAPIALVFAFGGMFLAYFLPSRWWQDGIVLVGNFLWYCAPYFYVFHSDAFSSAFPLFMAAFFFASMLTKLIRRPKKQT